MRKYDGIVFREIIKRKKRTIFTLLSITFSLALLILVGEVNNLSHVGKLYNEKFIWGDTHGKIVNISGKQALKLKQNSLIKDIGFSIRENYIKREDYEDGGYGETTEEVFYADKEYFDNILLKDFSKIEGRYPENENEVVFVNPSDTNIKIGDKTTVKDKKRTIVGILNTEEKNPIVDHYKILGIEDVNKLSKVTANIRLVEEKNMAEKVKEVGKSVGVEYIFDRGVPAIAPEDKPYVDINIGVIQELGEEIKVGETVFYPDKSSEIFQMILIVALIFLTYITINVSVKDKRKVYSMLKCIGASNGQIRTLILKEGLIMAVLSIVPGVILGEIIFYGLKDNLLDVVNYLGLGIDYNLNLKVIITAIVLVFVVTILASLVPMIWVSKLSPIEGIREGKLKGSKRRIRSKFIRRILGCEGEIAYKNLRSDKGSLIGLTLTMTIALVIFNTFTSYYKFSLNEIEKKIGVMSRDLNIWKSDRGEEGKEIEQILDKYKEYGNYAIVTNYSPLLRIQGIDKEIIRDSQAYKYYDEEENMIMGINSGVSIVSVDDKGFEELIPYSNGKNITLEEFKNNGAIFFSNRDEGAIHPPKTKNDIRVYINDENTHEFENAWDENNEIGRFIVPKGEKTIIKDLKIIGTTYLETLNGGYNQIVGRFNGIIISKDLAKELKLTSLYGERYIFEFKNKELREKYIKDLEKDIEKNESIEYLNTIEIREEKLEYLNSLAKVIYTLLGFIIALMILSIVNIKDIVLNNRKKEFGTLFALGMDKKMLKKSLIYEGLFQGITALIIGNIVSIWILIYLQNTVKKFTFSYEILLIGSLGIMVICILNILNSVRRLNPKNAIDLMRSIE